jgi:hypothetical protein
MSNRRKGEYNDSYPTCVETYSTLRVFSDDLAPAEITGLLHIKPTETFRKGDFYSREKLQRKTNGWFYSTKKRCSSKDTRRHVDLILVKLDGKLDAVKSLRLKGSSIDITSYWLSIGQGGPSLMPGQMLKLGAFGIDVWWDVYFEKNGKI